MRVERKHITFIDDSAEEIGTFLRLYASRFKVTAVQVQQPSGAVEQIADRLSGEVPNLFILDLWFPQTDTVPQGLSPQAIRRARNQVAAIIEAASKLPDDLGQPVHLLKQAHGVVRESQWLLSQLCEDLHQSPSGGVRILKELEDRYAAVPKIFYSRKATIADVKAAIAAGAADCLSKPHPSTEDGEAAKLGDLFMHYCSGGSASWLKGRGSFAVESKRAARRLRK